MEAFRGELQARLSPMLDVVYGSGEHLDAHIKHVIKLMVEAAEETFPVVQPRRKVRMKTMSSVGSVPKVVQLGGYERRQEPKGGAPV